MTGVLRGLGGWGSTVASVPHGPTPTAALPTRCSCLGGFVVFSDCTLTFALCQSFLVIALCTDCFDRLHSASSSFYVIAEAPFCWLGFFEAIVSIICVSRVTVTVTEYLLCESLCVSELCLNLSVICYPFE